MNDKKTAILLMGHGSRVSRANDVLQEIADQVRREGGFEIVEISFRELQSPDIQTGIDRCVEQGAARIVLYPYFLFAGAHVLEDLPHEMEQAKTRYPELEMTMGEPLGSHPKLSEIVCERINQSLAAAGWST